jgi:hypothetical protein
VLTKVKSRAASPSRLKRTAKKSQALISKKKALAMEKNVLVNKGRRAPSAPSKTSDDFQEAVVGQVAKWAQEAPDEVFIAAATSGKQLTRTDVKTQVEKKTPFGVQLLNGWMQAAIRSVLSAK